MKNQIIRMPDGRQYGRDGNKDYDGWNVFIWQENKPVEFRTVVKAADGLWIARL